MKTFFVWCPEEGLSSHLEHHHVEGEDPDDAARSWADDDADGNADGVYHGSGRVLSVVCQMGKVHRIRVRAEMVVEYRSEREVEP